MWNCKENKKAEMRWTVWGFREKEMKGLPQRVKTETEMGCREEGQLQRGIYILRARCNLCSSKAHVRTHAGSGATKMGLILVYSSSPTPGLHAITHSQRPPTDNSQVQSRLCARAVFFTVCFFFLLCTRLYTWWYAYAHAHRNFTMKEKLPQVVRRVQKQKQVKFLLDFLPWQREEEYEMNSE